MPNPVAAATRALEFRYVGGDACVDFVNTVDWTAGGLVDERLSSYARLTAWATGEKFRWVQMIRSGRRRARCATAPAAK